MSFVYLGYFDESASPVLLDVQVEPFRLDLQHFRGQLLLARLARTCFGFENRQKKTHKSISNVLLLVWLKMQRRPEEVNVFQLMRIHHVINHCRLTIVRHLGLHKHTLNHWLTHARVSRAQDFTRKPFDLAKEKMFWWNKATRFALVRAQSTKRELLHQKLEKIGREWERQLRCYINR